MPKDKFMEREYNILDFLKVAFDEVGDHGFRSATYGDGGTAATVWAKVDSGNIPAVDMDDLHKFMTYIDKWHADNPGDYVNKVYDALFGNREKIKRANFGLVCAAINSYLKKVAKDKKLEAESGSEFQGEVGGKVTFKGKSVEELFSHGPYAYGGSDSFTYKITDNDGNIYLWTTTKDLVPNKSVFADDDWRADSAIPVEGTIFTGTVKAHKEYRGIKQTVITRVKANY